MPTPAAPGIDAWIESGTNVRLAIDGRDPGGNIWKDANALYTSRWQQWDGTWSPETRIEGADYYGGDPSPTHPPTPNRKYRYRVRGRNADGFGPYAYSPYYIQTIPNAPSGPSASLVGPNHITFSWGDTAAAPYYNYYTQIWWNINGGGWGHYTNVGAGTTSYAFTGLSPGATYQFAVQHVEQDDDPRYGDKGSGLVYSNVVTSLTVPNTPGGITATRQSDSTATLSWANNSNGGAPYDSLTLQRWDSVGNAWATIANLGGTATSVTDSGLVAGRKYQWRIIANNSVGSSGWSYSGNVFTTPSAPSGLNALYTGGTSVKVSWQNNVSYPEYGVRVQAYKNGVADGAVISLGSGATSYTLESADNTASYYFKVWAVSDVGALSSTQVQSNSVTAAAPPGTPTNLAITPGPVFDVTRAHTVSWLHNPSTDGSTQTKRQLRYREVGTTLWAEGVETTTTSSSVNDVFNTIGVPNGKNWEWQVRTWGVHPDPSPWSATFTVQTSAVPTVAITSPESLINTSVIDVAWSYYDAEATTQTEWEVALYDGDTDALIRQWRGADATSALTLDYSAEDFSTYRVKVRIRDASGLWSDWAMKTFESAFTPPAEVLLTADLDNSSGAGILSLASTPTSTPGEVVDTNLLTATQPRVGGWSPASGGGSPVASSGNQVYSPNVGGAAVGDTFTALFTLENTSTTETFTAVAGGHATDGTGTFIGNVTPARSTITVAPGETVEVRHTYTIPTGGAGSRILVTVTGANAALAEGTLYVNAAMIVAGAYDGTHFDGDTARDSTYYYEWTGTANASTSVRKQIGALAASAVTIERRFYDPAAETWSDWELFVNEGAPDVTYIDTTGPAHGDGEYRIITHSSAPSSYRPNTTVAPPPGDNRWLYVSGGPKFEVVCKVWANIQIEQTASRAKALHYFAGKRNPVIYSGEAAERTYKVSGILEDEASDPEDWIRLARQAGPVLLRAPGRRMYGSLSELTVTRIQNKLHEVSFSIQEVNH